MNANQAPVSWASAINRIDRHFPLVTWYIGTCAPHLHIHHNSVQIQIHRKDDGRDEQWTQLITISFAITPNGRKKILIIIQKKKTRWMSLFMCYSALWPSSARGHIQNEYRIKMKWYLKKDLAATLAYAQVENMCTALTTVDSEFYLRSGWPVLIRLKCQTHREWERQTTAKWPLWPSVESQNGKRKSSSA